jgi:DNA-binding transcriptional MerR regulator
MKRRGNRRYYQHHEVLLVRRIRELLYDQGFTISGARNRLTDHGALQPAPERATDVAADPPVVEAVAAPSAAPLAAAPLTPQQLRAELESISALLAG